MLPLITSVRSIKMLATGLAFEAIDLSTELYFRRDDGIGADVLLHVDDTREEQLVILDRQEFSGEPLLPLHLKPFHTAALSRIASFAERVRDTSVVSLPGAWKQYKHRNLVSFFAVPGGKDGKATRWIAQPQLGSTHDVIFRGFTTSNKKETLEEFVDIDAISSLQYRSAWADSIEKSKKVFADVMNAGPNGAEISLSPSEFGPTKGWTYSRWLENVSADQRAFIDAPTDKSIRLRGPAGSGKTLALTLKAIREALRLRDESASSRILLVTHSWALATEISDSLELVGEGMFPEVDVFPLLEIAKSISPQYVQDDTGFQLIGNDGLSGKTAQLEEVWEAIEEFIQGDWITFRSMVSEGLRERIESEDLNFRFALAWDLLIEFGSVIGASAIFPGAGAEARYLNLARSAWMMPLESRDDLRVVYRIYETYMASLEARSLLTADQVMADLLSHLETHAWNRARKTSGYDLIFVDEFHLFSPLERQVLHYLSRDVSSYPRIFMALDPRQSPSESFIGSASDETLTGSNVLEKSFGEVSNFELTTVHRFTSEILSFVEHLHHSFPTFGLGEEWDIDFSTVDSSKDDGPKPSVVLSASQSGEQDDVVRVVQDIYSRGRIALAVVDPQQWPLYSALAERIGTSGKYHVSVISSRSEVDLFRNRRHGLVVAPVEVLAGLQFDTVLVAGIPDLSASIARSDRNRTLSLLYLGVSRAESDVRMFVNEHDGGLADVFQSAVGARILDFVRGSLV